MSGQQKRAARDIIATLAERFPACFAVGPYKQPLKVGIRDEVQAALAISEKEATFALRVYTNNARYLLACTEGAPRVGLNGEVAGRVTAEEAAHAKRRLAQLAKPERTVKTQPATTKPVAGRLSLGDLKTAAARRKLHASGA